jgi:hypothetical protein
VASFDLIRNQCANDRVFLYAFDLIELNGDDPRRDPLEGRKATLVSIVAKARPGIRLNEQSRATARRSSRMPATRPRRHCLKAQGLDLPFRTLERLAQVEEPGLRRGEAGGGRGLGRATDRRDRSLEKAFFSRDVGRFIWLHCSASSASLVHVRAMSSRMPCTRMLGARSAICRQSAARSLHSAGVNMATTPTLNRDLL